MGRRSPSREGPPLEPPRSPIRILSQSFSSSSSIVSFEERHLTTTPPVRGDNTGGLVHPDLSIHEDPLEEEEATARHPDLTEVEEQEQRAVLLAIRQSCLNLDDTLLAQLVSR